jgi:hypothetical protein
MTAFSQYMKPHNYITKLLSLLHDVTIWKKLVVCM